jgi:hypothetical protein
MPPGKALEMVTIDAAKGLGMADRIGSLEPGKLADVITVDLTAPHMVPANMPVRAWSISPTATTCATWWWAGACCCATAPSPHLDEAAVVEAAQAGDGGDARAKLAPHGRRGSGLGPHAALSDAGQGARDALQPDARCSPSSRGRRAAPPRRAFAQAWPTRPVRIVEPGAGRRQRHHGRLFAPHLEARLGQPFVVENRAGAGGRIGVENVFRSTPDGYTLLIGNAGSNGINAAIYRDLPYNLETDFTPISLLVTGPNALVVNPRVFPVNSVAELIAAVKARPPGFYNYGSGRRRLLGASLGRAVQADGGRRARAHPLSRRAAVRAGGDQRRCALRLIANLVNIMPFVRAAR